MKTTEAYVADCIVTDCPHCNKEVIEVNGSINDLTGPDIEQETKIECPHCKKEFLAVITE